MCRGIKILFKGAFFIIYYLFFIIHIFYYLLIYYLLFIIYYLLFILVMFSNLRWIQLRQLVSREVVAYNSSKLEQFDTQTFSGLGCPSSGVENEDERLGWRAL